MSYEKTEKYTFQFDAPSSQTPSAKVPDGPLTGDGDIGLVLACPNPGEIFCYLGK